MSTPSISKLSSRPHEAVASKLDPPNLRFMRLGDIPSEAGDVTGDINEVLFVVMFSCIGFIVAFVLLLVVFLILRRRIRSRDLDDEERGRNFANRIYTELDTDEQELYFQSVQFFESNPYFRHDIPLSQLLSIQEKGIQAFEFRKDPMLTNNDLLIVNKCELNFFKNLQCSAQTNIPIPMINEVYYFEAKIYLLPDPEGTVISVGLAPKPYPWFRLPGRHQYSISYDSNGFRRYNDPFPVDGPPHFPSLIQGDVIGVGYRVRSGTVFFTKNGKKVSELSLGGHIKKFKLPQDGHIHPTIGANNLCSVNINLGQMGFVYIEANVKKWGLAPLEGNGPSPPAYNKFNQDILLARSEYDESESERENDFPPQFWDVENSRGDGITSAQMANQSYDAYRDDEVSMSGDRITLTSLLPPEEPPSYSENNSDVEVEDAEGEGSRATDLRPAFGPDPEAEQNGDEHVQTQDTNKNQCATTTDEEEEEVATLVDGNGESETETIGGVEDAGNIELTDEGLNNQRHEYENTLTEQEPQTPRNDTTIESL
ncbi:Rsp5p-dependent ubiquitination, sorting of cargo proteins at the multivesicular body [Scheffersomyces spartinae]|uniref:Rsp5p-dependent ubiquitination, sorting of cargo proteins at the multivesicular body n=1 Tax=Scheffersomyces spartinae TaxID=45513 RepID=A0A9P7V7I3_9ASCO|nr:Rsp5p-dependent ubiquitination, sorting of cargo proteins at the multivesicular body [Scheffersomyces spartinae]KAG7192336.1 Rsp5p-dependent ubiquitination, sorting of cargo proteins at the multivesicular body [Scheffersomyces spartinae]